MDKMKSITNKCFKLENTYAQLPERLFSRQNPSHVPHPELIVFNEKLAKQLGIDESFFKSEEGTDLLAGNGVLEGTVPIAQAYAGHQFGYFTILGDGRAILLGEYMTPEGARLDVQLKGSGRTPYSRRGDGKAVLGPMLREYIISEAMEGLGIPTTRSLAVVTTGETVLREEALKGAILTRLASSHIRVGTFQYIAREGTLEELKALADYTLKRHFNYEEAFGNPYAYLLKEVVERQAKLVAKWQLVGFIHGVMNTDNVAISGETIDYGPCAFMDTYDPKTVFSSIDREGRYAYGNQPKIMSWNLARFGETLLPLISEDHEEAVKIAQDIIQGFNKLYQSYWQEGMRHKLGLMNEEETDTYLIEALLEILEKEQADYTNTFRALTLGTIQETKLYQGEDFKRWYQLWQERIARELVSKEEIRRLMESSNPSIIPRNHRVEEALAAAEQNDLSVMERLVEALTHPYDYSRDNKVYSELPTERNRCYKTYCGT